MDTAVWGGSISDRQAMISELKRVVQPHLRSIGFSGSFPHFRKIGQATIELVTFQFDRNGGGFVIEIARGPADGITTARGTHIPPGRTKAWDVHPNFRKRIQPKTGGGTDSWFRFDTAAPGKVAVEALAQMSKADLWAGVELQSPGSVFPSYSSAKAG
jgi:uncharacterized protein DUF4304